MTKKQQKAEAAKQALRHELYLMALGANSGFEPEPDPKNGETAHTCMGLEDWARWLRAIENHWKKEGEQKFSIGIYELTSFESIAEATEYLFDSGARAGGKWVA